MRSSQWFRDWSCFGVRSYPLLGLELDSTRIGQDTIILASGHSRRTEQTGKPYIPSADLSRHVSNVVGYDALRSLPLTPCRYTEAIGTLYAENIFDINHVSTVIYLSRSILPQRMNTIRSLQLDWYVKHPMYLDPVRDRGPPFYTVLPPHDAGTWEKVWQIIARMEGLRELSVSVRGRGMMLWGAFEQLLQPLMAVKQVTRFEVVIPMEWESPYMAGAPFRLKGSGVWK